MAQSKSGQNQISPTEIEAIEHELGGADCPEDLRENVQRLVDAYKLLQAQLAVVARVNSAEKRASGQAGDTSIM